MTFAEFMILACVAAGLYFLMKPLQRRLEEKFYRFFKAKRPHHRATIIDVTDSIKKSDSSHQSSQQKDKPDGQ